MNYKRILFLLFIGILILAAMILYIGPDEVLNAFHEADLKYVVLALLIELIILLLWTGRWAIICSELKIAYNKIHLTLMLCVGLAINNLTPSGRGGGEPVRAYILSKDSKSPFKKTFATVLTDKILDTLPFLVLAIISLLYIIYDLKLDQTMLVTLIAALLAFVLICAFVIYVFLNRKFAIKTVNWVFRQANRFIKRDITKYKQIVLDSIDEFQTSVRNLMKNSRMRKTALPLSFVVWCFELLRVYVIFLAFNTHVPIGIIASVFIVSTLVGMIPILPGGVGAVDGFMILLYSLAGVTPSISTAATLIERLISYWLVSGLGVVAISYFGKEVIDEVTLD